MENTIKIYEDNSLPILVVEDDEGLNHLIVKILRKADLQAEGVHTGKEAITRMLDGFQGFMLLDYLLPDMTGKDVVTRLIAEQKKVPFIIMTGHGDEKIAVEMMKFGARDYLIKDAKFINLLPRILKRAIRELTTEQKLTRSEQQLEIRNKINEIFLTKPNDEMYADVLDAVLETMKSPYGVFGYINAAGDLVAPSMTRHVWDQCRISNKQIVFPIETWGDSSFPRAIREKKSNYSNEKSSHTPKGHIKIKRHISMPIQLNGEVIGLFQVANKKTAYTENDVAMLEIIGSIVSPVLKARLEQAKSINELLIEKNQQADAIQVLAILNQPTRQLEAIHEVIKLIRKFTGAEAVGIRLKDGENFPYYQTTGFSQEFVDMENELCAQDQDGGILRDNQGKAILECMCGYVISGRTDPTQPFFTRGGSFWTNSISHLLASNTEISQLDRMQNCFDSMGYESMALIPFQIQTETVGLLQLSDHRRDIFTVEMIEFLEGLTANIAVSLARRWAEENLLESEKQLLQAQKMEAVGTLAGGIAHDFNNMLSVINGYAEISLCSLNPVDPLYKDIQEILKAGKRSAELTRQLLAFARKQTINPKVLNLNDLLEFSQKMLGRLVGEDLDLQIISAADLWNVSIDPSQFDQIITNLAVNARDAIHGVGKIIVETANMSLDKSYCQMHQGFIPGDFVMLSFSDSGVGMDDDIKEHIFEPFYTTKAEGKGTGLGLSTVFGIVKQSNGFMNVYSEPGKGTTFKIYLPKFSGAVDETTVSTGIEHLNGTETVLIVEDEIQILQLAGRILSTLGYTTLMAATPDEACLLVEKYDKPIHLLLTDVVMPTMNGRELMEKVEAIKPEIKTIFMSGYTADIIVHRGVLAQGIHFVQKPFSQKILANKVRMVLDGTVES
ncbi:MAG: response regulator [Proteobacteria bacterium]|nr:response regulator [Pseudomonadota bacterium]MBU1709997.1 response regulator [Pseudomonadota bacterium]